VNPLLFTYSEQPEGLQNRFDFSDSSRNLRLKSAPVHPENETCNLIGVASNTGHVRIW
jgi:hypothetical protein